ncbi:MAG TPA: HAD-IIB family hydrolase [Bacilli bacterium]|nr:HAD-IIB family hydrolase [Bacilli bacterium]
MEKYLILSDLDSTLLTTKKKIPFATVRYIRRLVNKGHLFVIATGRPLQGTLKYSRLLKINCPIVCDNGANIYIPQEGRFEHIKNHMNKDDVKSFFARIDKYLFSGFVGSDNFLYLENRKYIPWWVVHEDKSVNIQRIEGKLKDTITEDLHISFFQINKEGYEETISILEEYKDFIYRYWGEKNGVCTLVLGHRNALKGVALDYLAERYKINDSKTIAIGDQENDVSMIRAAYYGVAIKNCSPLVAEIASYQTEFDNDHQGVKKYLQNFFKNKYR